MDADIEIKQTKLEIEDYYQNIYLFRMRQLARNETWQSDIKYKEQQHKKIVDSFVSIYQDHPKLNFIQIVSSGLVANAGFSIADQLTTLVNQGYSYHVTRMLRILLSTSISNDNGLDELNLRTLSIKLNIATLFSKVTHEGSDYIVYQLLTKDGTCSENLQLFALLFNHKKDIKYEDIKYFISQLDTLDKSHKDTLLKHYAKIKLPFENGKIITLEPYLQNTRKLYGNTKKIKIQLIKAIKNIQDEYGNGQDVDLNKYAETLQDLDSLSNMIDDKYKILISRLSNIIGDSDLSGKYKHWDIELFESSDYLNNLQQVLNDLNNADKAPSEPKNPQTNNDKQILEKAQSITEKLKNLEDIKKSLHDVALKIGVGSDNPDKRPNTLIEELQRRILFREDELKSTNYFGELRYQGEERDQKRSKIDNLKNKIIPALSKAYEQIVSLEAFFDQCTQKTQSLITQLESYLEDEVIDLQYLESSLQNIHNKYDLLQPELKDKIYNLDSSGIINNSWDGKNLGNNHYLNPLQEILEKLSQLDDADIPTSENNILQHKTPQEILQEAKDAKEFLSGLASHMGIKVENPRRYSSRIIEILQRSGANLQIALDQKVTLGNDFVIRGEERNQKRQIQKNIEKNIQILHKAREQIALFADAFDKLIQETQEFISQSQNNPENEDSESQELGQTIFQISPVISFETLKNDDQINKIIQDNSHYTSQQDIDYKTRFNELGIDAIQNAEVDLSGLESEHGITLPPTLKKKNFKELAKEILKDEEDFVKNQIFQSQDAVSIKIQDVAFDLIKFMLQAIEVDQSDQGQKKAESITKLLFDKKQPLNKRHLEDIIFNKKNLDKIFKNCADDSEQKQLLESLLEKNPKEKVLEDLLIFLKNIDSNTLQDKKLALPNLIDAASEKFIIKHLNLFKFTTNFYLQSNISKNLNDLYFLVENISELDTDTSSIKRMLSYCAKNKEYSMLEIFGKLQSKLNNIGQLIDWFTTLNAEDIKKLNKNENLNFDELFKIDSTEKVQIIADIALKLENHLTPDQYTEIIKQVTQHDIYHAKQLHSYLIAPSKNEDQCFSDNSQTSSAAPVGLAELSTTFKVDIVMRNLESLKEAQAIFSKYGNWRFDFDKDKLIERIKNIKRKNIETNEKDDLLSSEEIELYKSIISTYSKIESFKDLGVNEIYEKALELKHQRSLFKDNKLVERRELDLEYLALIAEAMYRTTGLFPRDVQILAIVNAIVHDNLNIILEIATGEGKGIVSALLAAYLIFTGQTVDVVTSSEELAERDLQEFSPFYDALGIEHSMHRIKIDSDLSEYKKGGVNYGTASSISLFKADRNFYSEKNDFSFNTDVSVVCDEVDFTLTSEVNYKLATPLISTTPQETRALYTHILEFIKMREKEIEKCKSETKKICDVTDISSENLDKYLKDKFVKYDPSYKFPLADYKIDELKLSKDAIGKDLYLLYQAYQKCQKEDLNTIFDKLLNAARYAQNLREGHDYVLLSEKEFEENNYQQKVIPLIKSHLAEGVLFGNGVHGFVSFKAEDEHENDHPEWKGTFDIFPPASNIFNVSPKNFFDYYRMTGGRIIGLTGTAGSKYTLEEFRIINKLLAFLIPRYEEYQGIISNKEVSDKNTQQYEMLNEINKDTKRPTLIFCDDVNEAEEVYRFLKGKTSAKIQLVAASPNDTVETLKETLENAGKEGYITITTPMLGRGTNWWTKYIEGFLGISLCEHLTFRDEGQVDGRVARNGHKGKMIHIYNKEEYPGETIVEHMDAVAKKQKTSREESQPLTDILAYFNQYHKDNHDIAIAHNEFISEEWYKLLKNNNSLKIKLRKSLKELRDDLVEKLSKLEKYLDITHNLVEYINKIDDGIPEKISQPAGTERCKDLSDIKYDITPYFKGNMFESQLYSQIEAVSSEERCTKLKENTIPVFAESVYQAYEVSYVEQSFEYKKEQITPSHFKWPIDLYNSLPIDLIAKPTGENNEYQAYYNSFYKYQFATIMSAIFNVPDPSFKFIDEYYVHLSKSDGKNCGRVMTAWCSETLKDHEMVIFLKDGKPHYRIKDQDSMEIKESSDGVAGISKKIYDDLLIILQSDKNLITKKLSSEARKAILNFALSKKSIKEITIDGHSSKGDLMLFEFKKSFQAYVESTKSAEVNKVNNLVNNFVNVKNIETDTWELGEYQAIEITTQDENCNTETILTDGRLLFWVGDAGIKIFKITKDMNAVKWALNNLKPNYWGTLKTRDQAHDIIHNLVKDNSDNIPEPRIIEIKTQNIDGNYCGWQRNQNILKVMAMVGKMDSLKTLPDEESKEWKKLLKDSDDIYLKFVKFVMMTKAKETFDLLNKNIELPQKFLTKLSKSFADNISVFKNTKYEIDAHETLKKLELESTINLLAKYKTLNSLESLEQLHNVITTKISVQNKQALMAQAFIQHIAENSCSIRNIQEFSTQAETIVEYCNTQQDYVTCVGAELQSSPICGHA